MIGNLQLSQKKKLKKNTNSSDEESLHSMKNWIRTLEQSTQSVSSRLSAVEKRISSHSDDDPITSFSLSGCSEKIQQILQNMNNTTENTDIQQLVTLITRECNVLADELASHEAELSAVESQLNTIHSTIAEFKELLQRYELVESTQYHKLIRRMASIERREPPVMRLGTMEIPIEVTGIIGGMFAFIIAFLVILNQKEIILSPLFLIIIGCVLISSALFKTLNLRSGWHKLSKKTKNVEELL